MPDEPKSGAPPRSAGAIPQRRFPQAWPKDRRFRILALDGGGIRGIFPASVLAGLEHRYTGGRPIGAYFDLVTGLPNRRYMESRISTMLGEYKKNLSPFGLLLINILGFKTLNDKFGPEVGDQVLRSVARNIAAGVGPDDVVGRWDGTRCLVMTPNTKKTLLLLLAEKLRLIALHAANLEGSDDVELKVSMAGVINRMDDTTATLQQRLASYLQDSETREGALVLDEE